MQIHKPVLSSRLIINLNGWATAAFAIWVDDKLKHLLSFLPIKFKNTADLRIIFLKAAPLSRTERVATFDIVKFYPNIRTKPAIKIIAWWLKRVGHLLPDDFPPHQMLLDIIELIMNNNIFSFDDTHWLQKKGTAMGTNPATTYAELYFDYHEITVLMVKYSSELGICKRYVDDGILTWDNPTACNNHDWDSDPRWQGFLKDLAFEGLTFTHTNPSRTADIMDVMITLSFGFPIFKIFEKPQALHLYIPPPQPTPRPA